MTTKYTKNVFYTKEKVGIKIAYLYYKKPRALQIKQETALSADQYADHTEGGRWSNEYDSHRYGASLSGTVFIFWHRCHLYDQEP